MGFETLNVNLCQLNGALQASIPTRHVIRRSVSRADSGIAACVRCRVHAYVCILSGSPGPDKDDIIGMTALMFSSHCGAAYCSAPASWLLRPTGTYQVFLLPAVLGTRFVCSSDISVSPVGSIPITVGVQKLMC